MVAKSPRSRLREAAALVAPPPPLSPTLLRDTVKRVDKCVARLQELQYTVVGGRKVIYGGRYKEETFRTKNAIGQRSSPPPGKLQAKAEEWRRMSLPAMLVGETMREIVQTSRLTRTIVEKASKKHAPTTPPTERRKKTMTQLSELHSRRQREKKQTTRSSQPDAQRAKSRIIFDLSSPKKNCCNYIANKVSPRNKPWAKKTVMFPNPLFQSSPESPMIGGKNRVFPDKFMIKAPPPSFSKLQVKIRRAESDCLPVKQSPKSRRSFSPSKLAMRLVSPMRKSVEKNGKMMNYMMSGLKQRPNNSTSVQSAHSRI